MSAYSLMNLNISVCMHFSYFVPTPTFSMKVAHSFKHETPGLYQLHLIREFSVQFNRRRNEILT